MNLQEPTPFGKHLIALLSEAVMAAGGTIRIKANGASRQGKVLTHTVDDDTGDSILRIVDDPKLVPDKEANAPD